MGILQGRFGKLILALFAVASGACLPPTALRSTIIITTSAGMFSATVPNAGRTHSWSRPDLLPASNYTGDADSGVTNLT